MLAQVFHGSFTLFLLTLISFFWQCKLLLYIFQKLFRFYISKIIFVGSRTIYFPMEMPCYFWVFIFTIIFMYFWKYSLQWNNLIVGVIRTFFTFNSSDTLKAEYLKTKDLHEPKQLLRSKMLNKKRSQII